MGDQPARDHVELIPSAESAETDVGASLEGVELGEYVTWILESRSLTGRTSDSSNVRLQTPATEDLGDVEPTERAAESIVSEPATEARKRRTPPSQSSASEGERHRKRPRRAEHSAAPKTPSQGQSSSQTHVVTSVHSASRRPKSSKKAPKRKSQGIRKDVVPKWRMHIQALAVSDGTRRGTAEWPPKVEYTVKGRAVSPSSESDSQLINSKRSFAKLSVISCRKGTTC